MLCLLPRKMVIRQKTDGFRLDVGMRDVLAAHNSAGWILRGLNRLSEDDVRARLDASEEEIFALTRRLREAARRPALEAFVDVTRAQLELIGRILSNALEGPARIPGAPKRP